MERLKNLIDLSGNSTYVLDEYWYFLFSILARDYELDRDRIDLEEILGEGQFGDVHAGKYTEKVRSYTWFNIITCTF